jgi:predicted DNA-binding transcriptional regulator YafY
MLEVVRADRLVAILLMLQRRDQVTAAEVAEELEVSERTARRDLDALAMAGVPVYSQQGRGGGWRLAGGGRIDLSGLSSDEARALFLVAGPRAEATPEVRSALRKLVRALPEQQRSRAEAAAGAVVLDPSGWDRTGAPAWRPPLLDQVESAVIDGECLDMAYVGRAGESSQRVVHPLGLATKGRTWYLVADTERGMRTFRVDRIESVERTGQPVVRPDDFELSATWARIVDGVDRMRTPLLAIAEADRRALDHLKMAFGRRVRVLEGDQEDQRDQGLVVELRGHSVRSLATELAGFGDWVRVRTPTELRDTLGELGSQLVRLYQPRGDRSID